MADTDYNDNNISRKSFLYKQPSVWHNQWSHGFDTKGTELDIKHCLIVKFTLCFAWQHQAITWSKFDCITYYTCAKYLLNLIQSSQLIFLHNGFKKDVYKMVANLFRPQCIQFMILSYSKSKPYLSGHNDFTKIVTACALTDGTPLYNTATYLPVSTREARCGSNGITVLLNVSHSGHKNSNLSMS